MQIIFGTLVHWHVTKNATSQRHNVRLHNVKMVYIMNAFSVDIPMSQCTIGHWYITKNALLYHIKLTRNLCNSICIQNT